jgi:hypothetical protein
MCLMSLRKESLPSSHGHTGHKVSCFDVMTTSSSAFSSPTRYRRCEAVCNFVAAAAGVPCALSPVGGDSAAPESIESRFNSQLHLQTRPTMWRADASALEEPALPR